MKKNQLVSIIVPMYNAEKYMSECLDSLINQDYENLEIVLVDDGSTDKTLKICNEYAKKDKRVKVIHQKNSGVSEARNNGINKSTGEYITFVDSDDFIAKDFISYYVELINKTNADIALSRMPVKYRTGESKQVLNNEEKIEVITGKECALEMLYYKIFIASWNKLFKRKLLVDNNILFNKNIHFGEGFNYSVDAFLKANKVCITSLNKYYYRVDNESSVMTKFSLNQITGSIGAQKHLQEKYDNIDAEISKALKYANWHTYFDCLNSIIGTNNVKNNVELYKKIKKVVRSDAKCAFSAPISKKEKMKALVCSISPVLASKLANKFRRRKFNKN